MLTESEKDSLNSLRDTLLAIEDVVHIIAHRDHNPWLYWALVHLAGIREQMKKAVKMNQNSEPQSHQGTLC